MRIFICNRSTDRDETKTVISNLLRASENSIAVVQETDHTENWHAAVEQKMQESDFVMFLIGQNTFKSEHMIWEYAKAKILNKRIVGYKLSEVSEDSILYCQGFQIFDNPIQCFNFLCKTFEEDRQLKLEQYRMMFDSTQKVTEQRLTVNNLFFTLTATILSVGFIIGKTFQFSITGTFGLLLLSILAFIVTFYWEKLVNSYGNLNTGKFKVIDKIEKQLRTNMFNDEWRILMTEVKYEANTRTEVSIIKKFRLVILIVGIIGFIFMSYKILILIGDIHILKILFNTFISFKTCNC